MIEVLKERLQTYEAFDPTSCGPNPEATEGQSVENPYAAWNAKMRTMEETKDDGFNEFRQELGVDRVNEFLAKFGLGPNYKPSKRKTYPCPKCKKTNAVYKEEHADTDMNEMVLECPDCGHCSEDI